MKSNIRARLLVILIAIVGGVVAGFWDELTPWWRGLTVGLGLLLVMMGMQGRKGGPTLATDPDPRLGVLAAIVADETRRPWTASTLPWLPTGASAKPILLIPAADYHLAEIVPVARELNGRGIPTRIAIGPSPWERTWPALTWYPDLEVFALPEPEAIVGDISAVLVMKDTGSLGPFVERCRRLGVRTLGKVEGAQDFWDADTPEARLPYRNLDLVLCQGGFDAAALADRQTAIVGSTRLERMWWAPPVQADEPLAIINLNFVYGVGTKDRRLWLDTAIAGCERAGIPYVISVHPAEKARIDSPHAISVSASRLLPRATVLISRFSTMPLEAMARGVSFVYHNPHGETVKTFSDPMGAFETTTSVDQLVEALGRVAGPEENRSRCEPFFLHHVDVDRGVPSESRSADVIVSQIRS